MTQAPDSKLVDVESSVQISQAEALKAAKGMLARGIKIEELSLRKIKKELGERGTLTTIAKALETLKAEIAQQTGLKRGEQPPTVTRSEQPATGESAPDSEGAKPKNSSSSSNSSDSSPKEMALHHFESAAVALFKVEIQRIGEAHQRELVLVEQRGDERVRAARAEALLGHLRWTVPVIGSVMMIAAIAGGVGGFLVGGNVRQHSPTPLIDHPTITDKNSLVPLTALPSTTGPSAGTTVGPEKAPGKGVESNEGGLSDHSEKPMTPVPEGGLATPHLITPAKVAPLEPPLEATPKREVAPNGNEPKADGKVPEELRDGAL